MENPIAINNENDNSHSPEKVSQQDPNTAYQLIADAPIEYEERDDVIEDNNVNDIPAEQENPPSAGNKWDDSPNDKRGDTRVIRYGERRDGKSHHSEHGRHYSRRDSGHKEETITKLLHIRNLTRPYLLDDLLDLLSSCGTFTRESIWQDKIKFRCFVEYENEEVAKEARNALNGMRWPPSNPRQLRVEYSDETELTAMKARDERMSERTDPLLTNADITVSRRADDRLKITRKYVVREWDVQKDDQVTSQAKARREEEHSDFPNNSDRLRRQGDEQVARAQGEKEAEKLLESLFIKTVAKPSIFWCQASQTEDVKASEQSQEQVVQKTEETRGRQPASPERRHRSRRSPERPRRSRSPRRHR